MPAGFIVDHALAQPDDGLHAEIGLEVRSISSLAKPGLRFGIQQTLFGDQCGALAIHMDGAAFVDERRAVSIAAFDLENLAARRDRPGPRESRARLSPPQALKRQSTPRRTPLLLVTNVGPTSRIHASSCDISMTRTWDGSCVRANSKCSRTHRP